MRKGYIGDLLHLRGLAEVVSMDYILLCYIISSWKGVTVPFHSPVHNLVNVK